MKERVKIFHVTNPKDGTYLEQIINEFLKEKGNEYSITRVIQTQSGEQDVTIFVSIFYEKMFMEYGGY